MARKIIHFTLAVMFLIFAFVQVNDPDPLLWIITYGTLAALSVMAAFDYFIPRIMLVLLVVLSAYAVTLFPAVREWLQQDDLSMLFDDNARSSYTFVEESREFLGLIICIVVLLIYLLRARVVRTINISAHGH